MLRFTRHARNRMRRDRVDEEDVRHCIDEAEARIASIKGRINYTRRYREGTLRVTAVEEGGDQVVITVTLI